MLEVGCVKADSREERKLPRTDMWGPRGGVKGSSGEINNYEMVQRKFQALSNCQGLGKLEESQEK